MISFHLLIFSIFSMDDYLFYFILLKRNLDFMITEYKQHELHLAEEDREVNP